MFPLQATVFFSNNRAVFNGSVFARGVWSCFPMLDHEERWRASISLSSYQWALGRSNEGDFVVPRVSLRRWYHFPLCSALLCLHFSPLLCLWFWHAVPWLQCTESDCNISGTNMSVTVTATLHATNIHKCMHLLCVVMSSVLWHAMRQITSSLTATSQFPNEATEHEKGWSSRSSNRVE